MAGERGGSFASRVFLGLGLGGLYTLFQNENLFSLFPSTPNYSPDLGAQHLLRGGAIRADVTPEYLGVGYIIGARVAAVMLAGGVFSWLVLMPAIYFFGSRLSAPLYPGTTLIRDMSPSQLWSTYVRPMGAGAVACSGLITLLRTAPTILAALAEGFRSIFKNTATQKSNTSSRPEAERSGAAVERSLYSSSSEASGQPPRTEHDLPWSVVIGGSVLLVVLLWIFLQFKPVPGAQVGAFANLAAAFLVVLFGFLFVTVSARIVGIVGSSASPVSGMTIATLMATAAIFLVKGWTAPAFGALAITIGGIVCIAAANAGDTAQDLKTGYLIGATPWKQQLAIMIGVIISVFSIGITLNAMNKGLESFQRMARPIALNLSQLPDGVQNQGNFTRDHIVLAKSETTGAPSSPSPGQNASGEITNTQQYVLLNSIGSSVLADGKYLYNPATGQIEIQWTQGIGSEKAAAPQGRLMATVINGILSRKLPWSLVLLGVALVIMVEMLGVRSLTLAVGAYLSIGTTLAIFVGGVMRWMVDRAAEKQLESGAEAELQASLELWSRDREAWLAQHPDFNPANPEHLDTSTGLPDRIFCLRSPAIESEISSGSLFASGLIAAGGIVGLLGVGIKLYESATDRTIPRFSDHNLLHHDWVSVLMFALLAYSLYHFARKPLDQPDKVSE
jgi:uncharacterized oligopeptide transporter (OPT) family protein